MLNNNNNMQNIRPIDDFYTIIAPYTEIMNFIKQRIYSFWLTLPTKGSLLNGLFSRKNIIKFILFINNNINVNIDNTVTTPYNSSGIWMALSAFVFAIINDKHALTVGMNRIVFVNIPIFEIYLYANILGYLDLYYVLNIS